MRANIGLYNRNIARSEKLTGSLFDNAKEQYKAGVMSAIESFYGRQIGPGEIEMKRKKELKAEPLVNHRQRRTDKSKKRL